MKKRIRHYINICFISFTTLGIVLLTTNYSFVNTDLNLLLLIIIILFPILNFSLSFESIKSKILVFLLTIISTIILGSYPVIVYSMAMPSKMRTTTWILNENYEVSYGVINYWAGPGKSGYFLDHYFLFKTFKKEVAFTNELQNNQVCEIYFQSKNRKEYTFNKCTNELTKPDKTILIQKEN